MQIGDVFSIKLSKINKFGIFQIIQPSVFNPNDSDRYLIRIFDWYSDKVPQPDDVLVKKSFFFKMLPPVLKQVSFKNNGKEAIYEVSGFGDSHLRESLELKFIFNARTSLLKPIRQDRVGLMMTHLKTIEVIMEHEWRWRYDRANLIAEREANRKLAVAKAKQAEVELLQKLKQTKIEEMKAPNKFKHWQRIQGKEVSRKASEVWNEGVTELVKVKNNPEEILVVFENILKRYNDLHTEYGDALETEEREDLYKELRKLAIILKVDAKVFGELFDKIRIW